MYSIWGKCVGDSIWCWLSYTVPTPRCMISRFGHAIMDSGRPHPIHSTHLSIGQRKYIAVLLDVIWPKLLVAHVTSHLLLLPHTSTCYRDRHSVLFLRSYVHFCYSKWYQLSSLPHSLCLFNPEAALIIDAEWWCSSTLVHALPSSFIMAILGYQGWWAAKTFPVPWFQGLFHNGFNCSCPQVEPAFVQSLHVRPHLNLWDHTLGSELCAFLSLGEYFSLPLQ
jgi:hypothetical protein